ncbi:pteridine reductase [Lysobacter sp. A03]|uniref:pteridine reductase n=1 Tax=Lysobacter sp. A03 TaxID=1199154 RepID=UPI0005B6EC0D|nr:pteridine reductase [Lysobacter sp. A03]KIQ96939.1 FolM Alternative dihydrofolate reductase 1 [Lysobacter sp. A03]
MSRPVALVTGSAKRIGAQIARTLHTAGYDLALHYRSSRVEMEALAAELEAARPGSTLVLQADLADFDRLPEMIAHTVGRFGRLDGLVNNASGFTPTPIGEATPQQWDTLFASNARAPFFLAQAAAPHLAVQGGAIVNMVDIYAERPLGGHTIYCMAKAALLMATRSLALELGPQVRVNAVAPGAILWPHDATAGHATHAAPGSDTPPATADQAEKLARTPLQRTGTPVEVAEAVRWLLQDASYCTGQVVHVDGGRMLAG